MLVEKNVPLQHSNTFGIVAKALTLVRVTSEADIATVLQDSALNSQPKFVLGGGSNIVLTGDVKPLVLKVELMGKRLHSETAKAWIVEASAGENWHELVTWTLENGYPGLENMALIPGLVGASPVQNIGAYGVELQDCFESLDAIDLTTGQPFTLNAAQCAFGYRDSVFKHTSKPDASGKPGFGLAGKALITRVRFALPKAWPASPSFTSSAGPELASAPSTTTVDASTRPGGHHGRGSTPTSPQSTSCSRSRIVASTSSGRSSWRRHTPRRA